MNAKHASSLMFVGFGLFSGILAVALVQNAAMVGPMAPEPGLGRLVFWAAYAIPILLLALLAVQLIRHRYTYSNRVFPYPITDSSSLGDKQACVIAVSLLGLFFAVTGLTASIQMAATTLVVIMKTGSTESLVVGDWRANALPVSVGTLASAGTQLVIGVLLLLFRSRLAALVLKEAPTQGVAAKCPHCGEPFELSSYRTDVTPVCSKCKNPLPK